MFKSIAHKVFGNRNDRMLKKLRARAEQINALEDGIAALSDDALAAKTVEFRQRLTDGQTLEDILPEAFAVVREASKRVMGERHYDVQLMGGMVLHMGKIPEMRTGEGKTLVATGPVYLNALSGKGVHVVTVNDYLAVRDAEWMGRVYRFLGLTVGAIAGGMSDEERRAAYACDVTYSTNNELGFDYLRDNMKFRVEDMVQRPFHFAIIDEVDSILIDEARTPLIISGPSEDTTDMYVRVNALIPSLTEDDIERDEKHKNVFLTESGTEKIEQMLRDAGMLTEGNLYDAQNMSLVHHVTVALRAHQSFARDKEYIVKDGKIVIIDEFTGRMMAGRRFSDGLHQALEAKEGVTVERENQTLASITFQNFFRMYPKFSGMTGTAFTEAGEFAEIYNLDVMVMPTHRPVQRIDHHDEIYRTEREKNAAIVQLVKEAHERKQPVLVGTTSIESSERLSNLFKHEKIPHEVLNARHHEQESAIVSLAGRPGAVTVATNMAGRGTDIKLGGNVEMLLKQQLTGDETPEQIVVLEEKIRKQVEADKEVVLNAGGLYVVGTERHESRRIDNQLRGRSGRQGDPGASKFFISLEDDLMRIFGAERMDSVLQRLGIKDGQAIYHPWINTAIERAQKKVEGQHFDARRHLLRFDNVMNDQRKVVYEQRRELMTSENLAPMVAEFIEDVVLGKIENRIPYESYKEKWDVDGLTKDMEMLMRVTLPIAEWSAEEGVGEDELTERLLDHAMTHWAKKRSDFVGSVKQHPTLFGLPNDTSDTQREQFATAMFNDMERNVVLQMMDKTWKEHLLNLDHLRQGINLRSYAQRDPLNEYKAEAFALFQNMLEEYRQEVVRLLLSLTVSTADELQALQQRAPQEMQEIRHDPAADEEDGNVVDFDNSRAVAGATPFVRQKMDMNDPSTWTQTPRNSACPCGSGKKYKHCHGAIGLAAQ